MRRLWELMTALFLEETEYTEYEVWEWESDEERNRFRKYFRWAN